MRKPSSRTPLRILAVILIAAAVILAVYSYASGRNLDLAEGSVWGGVPVGGLTIEEAVARVEAVYSTPIVLQYLSESIQAAPQELGFKLDAASMAEVAARQNRTGITGWLWNNPAAASMVDLQYSIDGEAVRSYLENEIAARYDASPVKPLPVPGTTNFTAGSAGWLLNVQRSGIKITRALTDPIHRTVELEVDGTATPLADPENLEIFLKQTIASSGFDGIAEIFLQDPKAVSKIHFAVHDGAVVPPEIAFSAASTIKIPVMVSVLRRQTEPLNEDVKDLMDRMIELSENPPADALMQAVMDPVRAPLEVTEDMQQTLGLENTFLAGYFYLGADLLQIYQTPANTRNDVDLDPDIYNQTTASDMGRLLTAIYLCSAGQESLLTQAFSGEITQTECQTMLDALARNQIGVLSEAGVPDGTRVAHKHGWTEEADGYLHTVSDVGVVFSDGADFVFTIYLYDYDQLLFDPANELTAQLVQVMYNFFNPNHQENWRGEPVIFP